MRRIRVMYSDRKAVVDNSDYDKVSRHNWTLHRDGFACSTINRKTYSMHRFLMRPPIGVPVDHKNRDKLDNRRSNLRLADKAKNGQNRVKPKYKNPTSSKFKGVYWLKNRWLAYLTLNGKRIWLGRYTDEQEAARAYNRGAQKHFKEFACLNLL